MAKVKVNRETPNPPPIKDVVVTLSETEARNLSALLSGGVGYMSVQRLGLDDLSSQLSAAVPLPSIYFKEVAVVRG